MGGRAGWVMGIEEGTFWDEHWVLYGNQFDSKFHILKNKNKKKEEKTCVLHRKRHVFMGVAQCSGFDPD